MEQIKFEGVSKTYLPLQPVAVNDLYFTIRKGEIVTLLGPSGCGKTTILRLVAGFEKPEQGQIVIAGKMMASSNCWVPPEKRGVGMVFQSYALFPHLDIEGNVAFGLNKLPSKIRRDRVNHYLDLVGLSGYSKRYPHELSGGQQQRVALARALCPEPQVILLDEPFSNIDTELKDQMREELKTIFKFTGCTTILVTHDQKDALSVSDRIMVISSGAIQQTGTPRDLYLRPANDFVATFVGKSNILSGKPTTDNCHIETEIGKIACNPEQLKGKKGIVKISVRPEGFKLSEAAPIFGKIKIVSYLGSELECRVEIIRNDTKIKDLLIRTHPCNNLNPGDTVFLNVLPDFVSVI